VLLHDLLLNARSLLLSRVRGAGSSIPNTVAKKLYCYVDESGQDTEGQFFVVAVLVTADDREELRRILEKIENESGKRNVKWSRTTNVRRRAYIQRIVAQSELRGKICFSYYRYTKAYLELTAETIADAIASSVREDYKATILIDALPPTHARVVSSILHQLGVSTRKVRGIRDEESDSLVRLADAICGMVRDSFEGRKFQEFYQRAIQRGVIVSLKEK
jgi:hypothetical protein